MNKTTYRINPESINAKVFSEKRESRREEEIRQLILKGLEKGFKPFSVVFEKAKVAYFNMEQEAKKHGGQIGTIMEWAMCVAQRITNGESWTEAVQCPVAPMVFVKDDEQDYGISISNGFVNLSTLGMYAGECPLYHCNGKKYQRSELRQHMEEIKKYGGYFVYPYKDPMHTIPFVVVRNNG